MPTSPHRRHTLKFALGLTSMALAACGGGGSGASTTGAGGTGGGSGGGGGGGTTGASPTIQTQPQAATVRSGTTATFSVAANSASPVTYQWSRNGVAIPGATASTYTTGTLTAADDAAVFSVAVTNATGTVTSDAAPVSVVAQVTQVATHSLASFALYDDGTMWGWGYAQNLGVGDLVVPEGSAAVPALADGSALTGIASLHTSEEVCFALRTNGTVMGWGTNGYGELGDGTRVQRKNPVLVTDAGGAAFGNVVALAGGRQHTLAVRADGTVWAWGSSLFGQLGNGTSGNTAMSTSPVQVLTAPNTPLTGVTHVAASMYTSMALRQDGTVWSWGYVAPGDGSNGFSPSLFPVQAETSAGVALTNVVAIACGLLGHSLALRSDGTVYAWGPNAYGQLGDGTRNVDRLRPVLVVDTSGNPFGNVQAIGAGMVSSVLLRTDGTVWSFGANSNGALGIGLTTTNNSINAQRLNPTQVVKTDGTPLTGIASIRVSNNHTLALGTDGTVWAWGENGFGLLGVSNAPTNSIAARQIVGL